MPLNAIVTGAASGIGQEACRDLLIQGWTVYGLDVSDQALAPAARALSSANFHPRACDLRDAAAVAATLGPDLYVDRVKKWLIVADR